MRANLAPRPLADDHLLHKWKRASGKVVTLSVLLMVFMANSVPVLAQDPALQARFLSEYAPAEKKLQDFYGKVTIRANVYTVAKGDESETLEYEQVFKANGPLVRLDQTGQREEQNSPAGKLGVRVAGDGYGFRAGKNRLSSQFFLREYAKDPKEIAHNIRLNGPVYAAPFGFLDGNVGDLFRERDDFFVQELTYDVRDGKRLVKVAWGRKKETVSSWIGWFLFAPDDCWAVQEYRWGTLNSGLVERCVLEYGDKQGEIPLIKKASYWRDAEGGKRLRVETYEVTEFTPGAVPESEFRLSAFGLPELQVAVSEKGSRWYLWLGAAAIACLLVGMAARSLRRRATARACKTGWSHPMLGRLSTGLLLIAPVLLGLAGLDYFLADHRSSVTIDEPEREFPAAAVGQMISVSFPVHNRTGRTARVIGLAPC